MTENELAATFEMTWGWLHRYSTPGGGWTAKQLRAIGVDWPPRRGWLRLSVGKTISVGQKAAFEEL